MKTIDQINTLILSVQQQYEQLDNTIPVALSLFDLPQKEINTRNKNKLSKQLEFLRIVRNLLETDPNEDYLKEQVSTLRHKIAETSKRTVPITFYPDNFVGNKASYFNKKMGINDLRDQIKTLEFIIYE